MFKLFAFVLLLCSIFFGQSPISLTAIKGDPSKNILVQKLSSDSLSSSFYIRIQKKVKAHYHQTHSESVYVLAGEANFRLADKTFPIKVGDYIFIPKGSVHSLIVTSERALEVLSVQAPEFLGKDRIFVK